MTRLALRLGFAPRPTDNRGIQLEAPEQVHRFRSRRRFAVGRRLRWGRRRDRCDRRDRRDRRFRRDPDGGAVHRPGRRDLPHWQQDDRGRCPGSLAGAARAKSSIRSSPRRSSPPSRPSTTASLPCPCPRARRTTSNRCCLRFRAGSMRSRRTRRRLSNAAVFEEANVAGTGPRADRMRRRLSVNPSSAARRRTAPSPRAGDGCP